MEAPPRSSRRAGRSRRGDEALREANYGWGPIYDWLDQLRLGRQQPVYSRFAPDASFTETGTSKPSPVS